MKKTNINVDFEKNALVVSKAFYKKACAFGSKENVELRNAMEIYKGFSIEFKVSDKKTYGGLTFERMADYIKTQADADARLLEFEAVKKIAKAKGAMYPLTKEWFFLTYPLFKEDAVADDEKATVLDELKKNADAEAQQKLAFLLGMQNNKELPIVA